MPVITAIDTRETQGGAINKCYYMPVIAALSARETQNLASLLADAIVILIQKNVQVSAIVFYTYPHTLFPIQ